MTNEEKFIKLCETSDFVLVDGLLGIYNKEYEEIFFTRSGSKCPPIIKVRDYDYYENRGNKWILHCNDKDRRYYVLFLNVVKN